MLFLILTAVVTGVFTGFRGSTFIVIGGRFSVRLHRPNPNPNPNPNLNPSPNPNPNPNPDPDPNQVRLRRSLFSSLMRQELDFFSAVRTGDMTSRLSADCQKVGFARDHNLTSASTLHLYSL